MKFNLKQTWVKNAAIILIAVLMGLFFIQLFAEVSFNYYSFSFNLRTRLAPEGRTVVAIPPVGQLIIKSHQTPWQLIITLSEIDPAKLEQQLNSIPPKEQWLPTFQREAGRAVLTLFLLSALYGLIGSAAALLALRVHPSEKRFLYGLLASFLSVALLIGGTVLTFQKDALKRPSFQGVLSAAPWAMNLINMGLNNIEAIGNNLKKVSQDLPRLYRQADQIRNMAALESDVTILHVSDIHNNPAAYDFIAELVNNFGVRFIIDTGDLTDYGTAVEAEIIPRIAKLGVPYVFVPGNHESPLILERLKRLRSVWVLSSGVYRIYGFSIAGRADPAAYSYNSDVAPEPAMQAAAEKLAAQVLSRSEPPEIVAVHQRDLAEELIGKVPVILHGHNHRYSLTREQGTVISNAGTTGAAGLRGLTKEGVPYSASILYWKKDDSGQLRLQAVDSIKINGLKGKLTIDRTTY